MISKVLCLTIFIAMVAADFSHHGHHGHAFSSQHIHRYDGPAHPMAVSHGYHHGHGGYSHGFDSGFGHDHHDYHAYPNFEFDYKVSDPHTGDHKSQHESRVGDVVKGYYSLHQPDGSERHVHYHGDDHTGFHADVEYSTHHHWEPKHYNHY